MVDGTTGIEARKGWMGLLARARPARLAELLDTLGERPAHAWLRAPEVGGVMVRGRMGGTGAPFNLGEMTVTRCSLRLDGGEVGHAHVQGRGKAHARDAAMVDALMQGSRASQVRAAVIGPLEAEEDARRQARAARAASTKVDFFTMVRGED
ncbi:phosphonate C-P lyase system protein PhnG [Salipiger mucosus]|uniref:PhnG protein n=1 Tax=Salipiger mucosus DSM 16094 TaxID=1123237 RepID=S9QLA3_9RHOB|nr:phosphonate C-P lyase system protein PhnG [Salipiger mucosus]EPX80383.1 PhnG protein [Salipiger mucosus DSM 16094]